MEAELQNELFCAHCSTPFCRKHDLLRHMQKFHPFDLGSENELIKTFQCDTCETRFTRKHSIKLHLKRLHPDQVGFAPVIQEKRVLKNFSCSRCRKTFVSNSSLRKHERKLHFVINSEVFECDKCQSTFCKIGNLANHKKRYHGENIHPTILKQIKEKKIHTCSKCETTFTRKYALQRHEQQFHLVTDTEINSSLRHGFFMCKKCDSIFNQKSNLINHMEKYHGEHVDSLNKVVSEDEYKPFTCSKCKMLFNLLDDLLIHEQKFHSVNLSLDNKEAQTFAAYNRRCYRKTVQCATCTRWLSHKSSLKLHLKRYHPEQIGMAFPDVKNSVVKSFICSSCLTPFGRKPDLERHEQQFHNFPQKSFQCGTCDLIFSKKTVLITHIKQFHAEDADSSNRKIKFACSKCPALFATKYGSKRHESTFHCSKITGNHKVRRKPVQCPLCKESFYMKPVLLQHFCSVHEINIKKEFLVFDNDEEFHKWKIKLEEETKCSYVTRHSAVKNTCKNVIYQCSRSGYYRASIKNRQRRLKECGSRKINGYCPAEMNVKIRSEDNTVSVDYVTTHVGHSHQLKYMRLNEEERKLIVDNLKAGVPVNELLQKLQIKISSSNEGRKRLHLINKNDVRNVGKRNGVYNPGGRSNVNINVNSWTIIGDESVLYCKFQDEIDPNFPSLNTDDFLLIIMTTTQLEKLKMYGDNIISVDCTGLRQYDFELLTVMTLDKYLKGYPCVFMFSNRIDEAVYQILIQCIKDKLPTLHPKTIMTDMTESFCAAWRKMKMSEPKFWLYCIWHVLKAWNLSIIEIESPEIRKLVRKRLYQLICSTDEETFQLKLDEFLEPGQGYDEFQVNFTGEYLIEKCPLNWSYCFRKFSSLNTNMNLEAFHKNLKYYIRGGRKTKRVEEVLSGLEQFLRKREYQEVLDEEGCTLDSHKLHILQKRHRERGHIDDENIECVIEDKVWFITSSALTENPVIEENREKDGVSIYSIERLSVNCDPNNCSLKCLKCDACIHCFQCSCIDYAIRNNMCKHIHNLCQYIKKIKKNSFDDVSSIDSFEISSSVETVPDTGCEKTNNLDTSPSHEEPHQQESDDCTEFNDRLEVIQEKCTKMFSDLMNEQDDQKRQDKLHLLENITAEYQAMIDVRPPV